MDEWMMEYWRDAVNGWVYGLIEMDEGLWISGWVEP